MPILKSHVYRKVSCTIINKHFSLLSEENKLYYKSKAYSFAARDCVKQVNDWMLGERMGRVPREFVFERGDEGETELRLRLTADLKRGFSFRPKKDTVEDDGEIAYGFVPLQAADWLAYEINNAHEEFEAGKFFSYRWPYEEFRKLTGEPSTYTDKDMEEQDKRFDLNRQIDQWTRKVGKG